MALPKRNLLIRGLYGLVMIGMFLFLAWRSWLPVAATPQTTMVDVKPLQPVRQTPAVAIEPAAAKPSTPEPAALSISSYQITGEHYRVDLNNDIERQINNHWQTFLTSALVQHIEPDMPVYGVYSNYDSDRNSVVLTLGIKKEVPGLPRVTVAAGRYAAFENETVLAAWQQHRQQYQSMRFESDFERWSLDRHYQPVTVTAYLGMK